MTKPITYSATVTLCLAVEAHSASEARRSLRRLALSVQKVLPTGASMEDGSYFLHGIKVVQQIERKYKRLFTNKSYVHRFIEVAVQVADKVEYLLHGLVAVEEMKQLSETIS